MRALGRVKGAGRRGAEGVYGLIEEDLDAFCPVFEGRHLGSRGFGDVVFHCLFAF